MAINYAVRSVKNPKGIEGTEYFAGKFVKTSDYTFKEIIEDIDGSTTVTEADAAAVLKALKKFIRKGSVDPAAIADASQEIIEYNGGDIRQDLTTVQTNPLNGQVYQMMVYLADTMKQDSGQNQFSRGEGGMGVTAASAIQALQIASTKRARMATAQLYEAYRQAVRMEIEVEREFNFYLRPVTVTVDGKPEKDPGRKVDGDKQQITLDGETLGKQGTVVPTMQNLRFSC